MDIVRAKLETVSRELSLILPDAELESTVAPGAKQISYRFFVDQNKNQFLLFPSGAETSHVVRRLLFGKQPNTAPLPTIKDFAESDKSRSLIDLTLRFNSGPSGALKSLWTDRSAIVLTNGQKKRIGFLVDVGSNQLKSVIKVPMGPGTTENVQKEISLLEHLEKSGVDLAPKPQVAGYLKSHHSPKYFYYTSQSYVGGERPKGLSSDLISGFLSQLRLKDQHVSLYDLAQNQMRRVLEADLASDATRNGLLKLLDRVKDKTQRPASLVHGDLRPSNLVVSSHRGLRAIDWEFSDRKGLEIVDFSHLVLDQAYTRSTHKTFSEMFRAEWLKVIQTYAATYVPGPPIELSQMLALQFAQHYLDRYLGFDRWDTGKLRRLANALHTDWPFD